MDTVNIPSNHEDDDPEMIDLGMRYNSHRTLRGWRPGDGLACSFTRRASQSRPCGPPVAGRMVTSHPQSSDPRQHKEVICAYHLSQDANPGDLRMKAERQAREQVLVAHWAEYQSAIAAHMRPLVEQTIGDLPTELKALVLDALARYDRAAATSGGGLTMGAMTAGHQRPLLCDHMPTGTVAWPDTYTPKVGASVYCCSRIECQEDAVLWIKTRTGYPGVYRQFTTEEAS